jgi:hypothetical protein
MENNDPLDHFRQSLQDTKGQLHVLDTSVPVDTQIAYFRYSKMVKDRSEPASTDGQIDEQIEILRSEGVSFEDTRYAMTFLAVSGDVKAYRALETYNKDPKNQPPSEWMIMSMLQARIIIESQFSDEKQIYIASGLGGSGSRMRFFAFFKSEGLRPFTHYQRDLIAKEFPFYIRRFQGEVEEMQIEDTYFSILFLMDLHADTSVVLPTAVNECNEYGHFIRNDFIVTNEKKFSEEDIRRELQQR